MELIFLGTSSMVPTKERAHQAMFLTVKNNGILIDCGEGTQRQMKIAGINLVKIDKILISHWHGDHVLGLPGLLQTLSSTSNEYSKTMEIYGPPGLGKKFEMLKTALEFELTFENREYKIESALLDHSTPSYGFSIIEADHRNIDLAKAKKLGLSPGIELGKLQDGETIEFKGKKITPEDASETTKGKKLTIIPDTALCKECIELADEADILIAEATYANDLSEKAEKYKHLTAGQAGLIANKANAKKLILTHFSQRYKNTQQIEEDARTVFDNVIAAKDFMRVTL